MPENGNAQFVFEQWHERIARRDGEALSELYAADARFESPLVPRVLDCDRGYLQGRSDIREFLIEITRRRPQGNELPSLYRDGTYFFDGRMLIWEYPRLTPQGSQLDLVEVMELDGSQIRNHRVYWGWYGTEHLLRNAVAKLKVDGATSP
ncbi:MAG TPA: nuclear transport factor 2 family protein [Solirubrobacteraceae bacterium]